MRRSFLFALMVGLMPGCRREAAPPRPITATAEPALSADEAEFLRRLETNEQGRRERTREAEARLRDPSSLTVFALSHHRGDATDPTRFHGHPILASVAVDDPGLLKQIFAQVRRGIAEGDERALCFFPRHALRAVRDGAIVDLVICFECSAVDVYDRGDAWLAPISSSAKPLLDEVLARAGFVRPPAPSPAGAIFAEDPRLDALLPQQQLLSASESWSSRNREYQHCFDFAFPSALAANLRSQVNAVLRRLSLPALDKSGSSSAAGVRVAFPGSGRRSTTRREEQVRVMVCTQRDADGGRMRAFVDDARWDPEAPQLPPELNALPVEAAALKRHRAPDPRRQIELTLRADEPESVAKSLLRSGFVEAAPSGGQRLFLRDTTRAVLAPGELRVSRE